MNHRNEGDRYSNAKGKRTQDKGTGEEIKLETSYGTCVNQVPYLVPNFAVIVSSCHQSAYNIFALSLKTQASLQLNEILFISLIINSLHPVNSKINLFTAVCGKSGF